MARETAEFTETIDGNKTYQVRGRQALPLLVRQALARRPITYTDLGKELGNLHPRVLNWPLGAIGKTLRDLGQAWGAEIPPVQCVVVGMRSGLPGEGIDWFLNLPTNFRRMSLAQRREVISGRLANVYDYPRWREVLAALNIPYAQPDIASELAAASRFPGGESEDHKRLKKFVACNPSLLGLKWIRTGETEVALPSGDVLDVSFLSGGRWVAAEVKSARSCEEDILRGIFQCVKYLAVMHAVQTTLHLERSARVVLVLEGKLPSHFEPRKNQLGIEVIENVSPR